MGILDRYLDEQLSRGRAYFSRAVGVLESFARRVKFMKPLDPSVKPLLAALVVLHEKDAR